MTVILVHGLLVAIGQPAVLSKGLTALMVATVYKVAAVCLCVSAMMTRIFGARTKVSRMDGCVLNELPSKEYNLLVSLFGIFYLYWAELFFGTIRFAWYTSDDK
jgi:hypothetical protein